MRKVLALVLGAVAAASASRQGGVPLDTARSFKAYRGSTPTIDGVLSLMEWDDAWSFTTPFAKNGQCSSPQPLRWSKLADTAGHRLRASAAQTMPSGSAQTMPSSIGSMRFFPSKNYADTCNIDESASSAGIAMADDAAAAIAATFSGGGDPFIAAGDLVAEFTVFITPGHRLRMELKKHQCKAFRISININEPEYVVTCAILRPLLPFSRNASIP